MKKRSLLLPFLLFSSLIFAEGDKTFKVGSPVFEPQSFIPQKYSCEGADISPALFWENPPQNVKSYVLIIEDPDAPNGNWVHWIVFNIPPGVRNLTEGELPPGAINGKNSWGTIGYRGPCPPSGDDVHRYVFKLFALDTVLSLDYPATRDDVINAIQYHVLASSQFSANYHRY
ncbi:YbhB/YbcL family Raf kinase inhibitor-like protein [Legionella jordanis]|uniref:Phosphatidylethanolamine-binding protein n=1 Tax=Legionella jordanis TaxID=456 RepID=A0A0W0V9I9_9GAMM|nr:YbhB/YbcL family Raf kinase inhibitor-like protein [Legionella jordanis]KTD16798.1 phosphatidylethanolamine-binding protein [Legionella jordanis]RMX03677.1 YbhB/YbcL family Raf kinase inhibitor-like protein [Legionella jordanis]RMX22262.1 YbhB/YbcL family Raf kinase inhibitor-like protein [Legionella jordanis]VEH11735.1 phosphatidylethanolamine-binding protein [Legionella jordanis]HAT8712953.1 YbhB/YbcL family Raf kinase inhibitor-like protein [Legionella jordanis]